ncbi:MAG: ribosome maturation factor RimP [Oscillospiraceae bacterium]|nr:ribosome maturation factor RimP [Oscillospiraceae bacterium]
MKVTDQVRAFSQPVVEGLGCTLWDVEYVREGGEWFLRLYIDKEGGVGIDDCEAVSRAVDPILDQEDPVPGRYHFEVSSAGLERPLRRPEHLAWSLGKTVAVRLYRPRDGAKEFTGVLRGYADGKIVLETATGETAFEKDEIALVRLHLEI